MFSLFAFNVSIHIFNVKTQDIPIRNKLKSIMQIDFKQPKPHIIIERLLYKSDCK